MNIIFACLADLSAFLRFRDDRDFEGILSKEVVSETSTLLRVLGTLVIDTNYDNYLETASQTKSTNSVSASSELSPTLSIFVGRAPVKYSQYLVKEINTCLLYTSPSPRDQRGSRMPSSA